MSVGERLRKVRTAKKISTYSLAKLIGVSQSTISKLENGSRKADLEILEKIADALEISIDKLTGEAVSCLIEDRLQAKGMTLEELAEKAGVNLHWLQSLDSFTPGEWGGKNDIAYKWITQVAEVLELPGGTLRAALARQEIPAYDGPTPPPEEVFGFENEDNEIHTIAAHHDGDEWTEEELEEIEKFKEFIRMKKQHKKT